uniref:ORF13 n=1 Tax=Nitrosopumilaceae spindle-shaped virus TaxID=3065433 RepID=A0AAT9JAK6_9VIRU
MYKIQHQAHGLSDKARNRNRKKKKIQREKDSNHQAGWSCNGRDRCGNFADDSDVQLTAGTKEKKEA